MTAKKDSGERAAGATPHILEQLHNLQFSVFGACTEILAFFFKILDPELYAEYEVVALELEKSKYSNLAFKTRRTLDIFSIRAFLVHLHTTEHKDESDWKFGFAGLVPVKDYTGGDLLLQELGIRIKSPPGCAHLFRGRELKHSISDWEGHRLVIVNVVHDSVRQWPENVINGGVKPADSLKKGQKRERSPSDLSGEEEESGEA